MRNEFATKAYAKINIALNVLGKHENLHNIDSIITNVDIYDKIRMKKRNDNSINVLYTNLDIEIKNDTAKKIAELIQREYNTGGVDITIEKHIPFGAGLGGSSADAAGVAKCLEELFDLGTIPQSLLLRIGSDVPYMYEGGNKRVTGKGEIIRDVEIPKAFYAIVVCPGGVNTAQAYNLYDKIGGENKDISKMLIDLNVNKRIGLHNALQKAAMILNPNIEKGLDYLQKAGFENRVMTGSGSGVLAMELVNKEFNEKVIELKRIIPENYKLYLT